MSTMSSLLCRVLFLLAITGAATNAVLSSAAAAVNETESNDSNLTVPLSLQPLALEDYCFVDPNSLDVPGQIFYVCPDFCGEGNDWSIFFSNNVVSPFTVFTCLSKCLPPGEDVFDCTLADYDVGDPSEVCPIFCPGSSVGGCGLFGLGKFIGYRLSRVYAFLFILRNPSGNNATQTMFSRVNLQLGIFCLNGCGFIAEFFGFCGCGFIRQIFGLC